MKKVVFILFFVCIGFSIKAQDVTYDLLNRSLNENKNLLKTNMTAQDYNVAGMFFYERQRWLEAEAMFSQATEMDNKHVLALYNLACVISIRLSLITPSPYGHLSWYNEIMGETIDQWVAAGYLKYSIRLDHNRGIRARQDKDFENLRTIEQVLFDAVTIPEDQRSRYTCNLVFIDFNQFEGDLKLIFTEAGNEDNSKNWYWFEARDEKFTEHNLYYYVGDEKAFMDGYGYWEINAKMVGKTFEIIYIYDSDGSSYRGGNAVYPYRKLMSIKSIP
jgi:hypothetical protein